MRTAAERGGPAARPRGRVLVRHGRVRRQRAARHRHRRRRRTRPLPLGGVPRRRRVRLHEHRSGRLLPRLRRDTPAVDRRAAGGRARAPRRASTRWRSGARTSVPGRGAARGRQAARRRPRRATSRRSPQAIGWDGDEPPGTGRGRVGRPARRRSAPGLERASCAWRPTGTPSSSSARPRSARAHAPSSPRSRPRS